MNSDHEIKEIERQSSIHDMHEETHGHSHAHDHESEHEHAHTHEHEEEQRQLIESVWGNYEVCCRVHDEAVVTSLMASMTCRPIDCYGHMCKMVTDLAEEIEENRFLIGHIKAVMTLPDGSWTVSLTEASDELMKKEYPNDLPPHICEVALSVVSITYLQKREAAFDLMKKCARQVLG